MDTSYILRVVKAGEVNQTDDGWEGESDLIVIKCTGNNIEKKIIRRLQFDSFKEATCFLAAHVKGEVGLD